MTAAAAVAVFRVRVCTVRVSVIWLRMIRIHPCESRKIGKTNDKEMKKRGKILARARFSSCFVSAIAIWK